MNTTHFWVYPVKTQINLWLSGECNLTGYELEELLGTKPRALYQLRKECDLFDLYWALTNYEIDTLKVIPFIAGQFLMY